MVDRQDEATSYSTSFSAGPGVYQLDVEVPCDLRCLDAGHPHLEVNADTEYYETGTVLRKAAAATSVLIGVIVRAFLPVVRAVGSSEQTLRLTDSETIGQDFQWARKLTLRSPISGLPAFGLFAGITYAILAMLMMLLTIPMTPKGIWVHLLKPGEVPAKIDSWTEPLVVRVKYLGMNQSPDLYVNSTKIAWENLDRTLKQELGRRREWVVYVGGDDLLNWDWITKVIDAARGNQAKVFLITGKTTLPQ